MITIEPNKTVLGHIDCPSCGAEVPLKMNGKGGVYAYCTNVVRPDAPGHGNNKYCWDRHNFSKWAGEEIKKEYLEQKRIDTHVEPTDRAERQSPEQDNQIEQPGAGNDEGPDTGSGGEGERDADQPGTGLKGKLVHFLTGD